MNVGLHPACDGPGASDRRAARVRRVCRVARQEFGFPPARRSRRGTCKSTRAISRVSRAGKSDWRADRPAKGARSMQTDRYDYSPIVRRKPFRWPNDARVALDGRAEYRVLSYRQSHSRRAERATARRDRLCAARLWLAHRRVSHDGSARQARAFAPPCCSTPMCARIIRRSSKKGTNEIGSGSATA